MEFKYRSIDKKPTTTSFPHSSVSYASESLLPDANNVLLRELKKEQIRWEIITGEIAWRHELEAEVWRELALESSLGAPYSLQQQLNPTVVDSPVEIKPSLPHLDKDKVIVLPRPKPDHELHCAKRKAVAPAVCDTEPSALGLSKKAKGKWSCGLCQVNVTSEVSFNKHLVGKKHKAKEASVMIGLDATPNKEPSLILEELNQTVVEKDVMESKNEERAQLVEKRKNVGGLENLSETEAGKRKTSGRKVWCEVCQIYTLSKVVMETHKKGKKHQMQMLI